jgi:hypothetical protein
LIMCSRSLYRPRPPVKRWFVGQPARVMNSLALAAAGDWV